MKVIDWQNVEFATSTCRTQQYINFENQCRRELKKQLEVHGIKLHKFNGNHFEWSAVLEKDGKFVYVRMSDVRWWDWYNDILIRTMAHDTDWHGGQNHKCAFDEIGKTTNKLFEGGYQVWNK